MEPIKAIGLLVVGILIGYSFTELSSENQALTSDVAPNIEKKLTDEKGNNSTIEEENISLIAKQIPCSKQCDQLSNDEANTLAGLVIHEAQMIPSEGQVFVFYGFRFEVMAKKENKITRLKIYRL